MSPSSLILWLSPLLNLLLIVLSLVVFPRFKNMINERIERLESKFMALEDVAHNKIILAVEDIRSSFEKHNQNEYAHPNLATFAKIEAKLEEVRKAIVHLEVQLATMATTANTAAQAAATAAEQVTAILTKRQKTK